MTSEEKPTVFEQIERMKTRTRDMITQQSVTVIQTVHLEQILLEFRVQIKQHEGKECLDLEKDYLDGYYEACTDILKLLGDPKQK